MIARGYARSNRGVEPHVERVHWSIYYMPTNPAVIPSTRSGQILLFFSLDDSLWYHQSLIAKASNLSS